MITQSVTAGLLSLHPQLILAGWGATILFLFFDRRSTTHAALIALTGPTAVLSLLAATRADTSLIAICGTVSGALAGWLGLVAIIGWKNTSPTAAHEESRRVDAKKNAKKGKARKPAKSPAASRGPSRSIMALCSIAVVSAIVLSIAFDHTHSALVGPDFAMARLQRVASGLLAGFSLATAVQLTLLSTPDALNPESGPKVRWDFIDRFHLAPFVILLALCSWVLLQPPEAEGLDSSALMESLAPKAFAMALMLTSFVAWMVPHRVASFQRKGPAKGWPSLAIATWLVFLGLVVVSTLPSDWPWTVL